jgi:uncharacterized protein (TIGR02145 family)
MKNRLALFAVLIIMSASIATYGQTTSDSITDVQGNIYHTIKIGNQTWMKENLKVTKYRNGTQLPKVTDAKLWSNLSSPAFCWYKNDSATYSGTYGALYNWFAINTNSLCPTGWHVPSDTEWTTLSAYCGGENKAGNKLKENGTTHWSVGNTAVNSSGFTAMPGGLRDDEGPFYHNGYYGYWWSSTELNTGDAWSRLLGYDGSYMNRYSNDKMSGCSVRCIRDK